MISNTKMDNNTGTSSFDSICLVVVWVANLFTGFDTLVTITAFVGTFFYALKQVWDFFGWKKPFDKKKP